MDVFLNGKRIDVNPSKSIGKGGEAEVYDVGGVALKLYKDEHHPDFANSPQAQKDVEKRLDELQDKLRHFPLALPSRVVQPARLATDARGRIVGYSMPLLANTEPLLRYADRSFRAGIDTNDVVAIFRDLRSSVEGIHRPGVVIGDANDLNVLVKGTEAYLIDADSFQFADHLCPMFTAKFVDPLLCDPRMSYPLLVRPHNANSDWYAFAVMLMNCLLFVDPYGGVYRPADQARQIPHSARPLRRISVFHPEVRYPKPAISYGVLPDDLLEYFSRAFEKDERGPFPERLLEELRWTRCSACGTEHARGACPTCHVMNPAAVIRVTTVRGRVVATRVFKTRGVILQAVVHPDGVLRYLYHEDGQFKRESGAGFPGQVIPGMRYGLMANTTLIGANGVMASLGVSGVERLPVDSFGNRPVFDVSSNRRYWASGGSLMADGRFGPERIGDVLQNQTLFWVGERFGFGFYRAGGVTVGFVFDAHNGGVNDTVPLPPITGHVLDARALFSSERCWFLIGTKEGSRAVNRCYAIGRDGGIEARAEAEAGDGSWLSSIGGSCAGPGFLLVPTDDGIVRVEPRSGSLAVVREFPDTEPFVSAGSTLLAATDGLYVVDGDQIALLRIS